MEYTKFLPEGLSEQEKELLKAALFMAKNAGDIHLKYFRKSELSEKTKLNDSDVVTIADRECEAFIIDYIHNHFPEHGILSEESGIENEKREWRWVIDPLDGTTNYANGLPVFCVSIALEYKHDPRVGVVYAPFLNEWFYAIRDKGAWHNGEKTRCSEKDTLFKAVLATGVPYDRKENADNNLKEINRVAMYVRGIRRMGSAAMDLCYTAAGYFDAYWELNLNRWDVAAGELIAKESGVVIDSIRKNRNISILASNPLLFPFIKDILNEADKLS